MAKATHNAGWSRLHVQYAPEDRQRGETEDAYRARTNAAIEALKGGATHYGPAPGLPDLRQAIAEDCRA